VRAQQRQAWAAAVVTVLPRDPLRQMATEALKALDKGILEAAES